MPEASATPTQGSEEGSFLGNLGRSLATPVVAIITTLILLAAAVVTIASTASGLLMVQFAQRLAQRWGRRGLSLGLAALAEIWPQMGDAIKIAALGGILYIASALALVFGGLIYAIADSGENPGTRIAVALGIWALSAIFMMAVWVLQGIIGHIGEKPGRDEDGKLKFDERKERAVMIARPFAIINLVGWVLASSALVYPVVFPNSTSAGFVAVLITTTAFLMGSFSIMVGRKRDIMFRLMVGICIFFNIIALLIQFDSGEKVVRAAQERSGEFLNHLAAGPNLDGYVEYATVEPLPVIYIDEVAVDVESQDRIFVNEKDYVDVGKGIRRHYLVVFRQGERFAAGYCLVEANPAIKPLSEIEDEAPAENNSADSSPPMQTADASTPAEPQVLFGQVEAKAGDWNTTNTNLVPSSYTIVECGPFDVFEQVGLVRGMVGYAPDQEERIATLTPFKRDGQWWGYFRVGKNTDSTATVVFSLIGGDDMTFNVEVKPQNG